MAGNSLVRYSTRCFVALGIASAACALSAALTAGAQTVAADASSRSTMPTRVITVNLDNVILKAALQEIARQAGLKPYYSTAVLESRVRVTLHAENIVVADAFERALRGTGLKVSIDARGVAFGDGETAVEPVVQGGITGKVLDAKTQQPLRGATITLDDAERGITSGDDGGFRMASVAAGQHTLRVRMLGYVKTTKAVTVVDGQTLSVEIALAPSVNPLDQVVVTGTVIPTELRAVPNAITVITAKQLEERGITRIEQLFRGDVPGLFARKVESYNGLDAVTMFSRGATALTIASDGTADQTNPIKTYVDGVELADPSYLSQIDPSSIERIEILTGPQASTIYGSNALNGVMQIFTKRGTSPRPQLTAVLQSGWMQNNFTPARTPQHDDQIQIQGVEGHWAYNAGGSWNYLGAWTPAKQTSRVGGAGGARVQMGSTTADVSFRLATTRNWRRGALQQGDVAARSTGWSTPTYSNGGSPPQLQTLQGQTLGLTLGYTPLAWWSHEIGLGQDQSAAEIRNIAPQWSRPSDTLRSLQDNATSRTSWRYTSTVQRNVSSLVKAVVTVVGDGWESQTTSLSVSPAVLTGTLNGTTTVTRRPRRNAGGGVQGQVGLAEQLFFTYGLRAEWNPAFGDEAQPNFAPRYGVSATKDITTPLGLVTTKVRASYGRSTRPPNPEHKFGQLFSEAGQTDKITYYGDQLYIAPNADLGPEFQQGGEGGIELFFGGRGSLVVTRYNQTVDALISSVAFDSTRSLMPGVPSAQRRWQDEEGYGYTSYYQYLNIGSIRNQGWEAQSTLNVGPFMTTGTYSFTKSRVIGVTPRYRAIVSGTMFIEGRTVRYHPEHTWALSVRYGRARTSVTINVTGVGQLISAGDQAFYDLISETIRLTSNRSRMSIQQWSYLNTGYALADLNVSHRFSSAVEGLLQVQNIADRYQSDYLANYATLGRQSKFGVRIRY